MTGRSSRQQNYAVTTLVGRPQMECVTAASRSSRRQCGRPADPRHRLGVWLERQYDGGHRAVSASRRQQEGPAAALRAERFPDATRSPYRILDWQEVEVVGDLAVTCGSRRLELRSLTGSKCDNTVDALAWPGNKSGGLRTAQGRGATFPGRAGRPAARGVRLFSRARGSRLR